jgi:hypothetical protein
MQNRSWYALEGLLGDHTVVVDLQFTGSGSGDRRGAATGGRSGSGRTVVFETSFDGVGVWGGVDDRHFSRRIYSLNRMMIGES